MRECLSHNSTFINTALPVLPAILQRIVGVLRISMQTYLGVKCLDFCSNSQMLQHENI